MTNEIKSILFASLIVAMILPFSAMNFADAAPNANDKAKEQAGDKGKDKEQKSVDRTKRIAPEPFMVNETSDKTPREKHKSTYSQEESPSRFTEDDPRATEKQKQKIKNDRLERERKGLAPPPTPSGTGHEYFGTHLDQDTSNITGVYSKNEVHDNVITLQDETYLYAPTTMSPNKGPFEIVTFYADYGSGGTVEYVVLYDHVAGAFDWTSEFTIDSSFINDYTLSSGGNDYYYAEVVKSSGTWYAYIYNFDTPGWEQWDSTTSEHDRTDGWVIWEEWYMNGNCPSSFPEIESTNTLVLHNNSWKSATSTYATVYDTGSICGVTSPSWTSNYYNWSVDD